MAITTEVRKDLITLVVGAFDAAPGATLLSDLVAQYNEGATVTAIANALGNSATFKSVYPTFLTNEEFATKMVNNIVGNLVSDSEKQWAVETLTAELNAGYSRAEVLLTAVYALREVAADEPNWGAAAATFNNKVEVATYHTAVLAKDGTPAELAQVLAGVDNTAASVDAAKQAQGGPASDDAAVTAAKTASDAANAAATAAIEAANTADAAVATAKTALDDAVATAAQTDAAALEAAAVAAETAAANAVTANTTAQANLTAANTALAAAIASGVQADVNTANANQIIAKYNADQAAANVTTTAEAATTARAAADAAAADDAAAAAAQTAYDAAIAASVAASADAVTAAQAAVTAADAYVAAAAVTPSTDDNTAAAAAKAVADAAATSASATGSIANAAIAEQADVAAYNAAKATFDAAEAKAAASAAAAQTAVDAAATAKAAVNTLATANDYISAADAASTAVATAKADAAAAASAAADLVAAAANTDPTTDDTSAAAAKAIADARVTSIAGLETTAAADVAAAALEPAKYTAGNFTLTAGGDSFTGGNGIDTFNAGTSNSLSAFDSLDGGAGADTLTALLSVTSMPGQVSIKNIETVTLNSTGAGFTVDSTGFTGLTSLTVQTSAVGDQSITASTTTNVTASTTGASKVTVSGGADQNVATGTNVVLSGATGAISASTSDQTLASTINGGTSVSYTTTSATDKTATIAIGGTAAPTGAVDVTATFKGADKTTQGTIDVTGGSTVTVTQKASNAVNTDITFGKVTVTGTDKTTSVTVTQDAAATKSGTAKGIANGDVDVLDVNRASNTKAGTITEVTLNSFGAATVNSGALTTLNLSGKGTSVDADTLGALTTATATATVALNLKGVTTTGLVDLDDDVKTVNIESSAASNKLQTFEAAGATKINISGDKALEFTNNTLKNDVVIVSTNTAGVTLGTALATTTQFTGGDGKDVISVAATGTKAMALGAGDDTVTYGGALGSGGSIDGGAGTDTIKMTSANAATATADSKFAGTVSNLEVLELTTATGGVMTINMDNADGINSIVTVGATVGQLDISNAANNFTLTQTVLNSAAQVITLKDANGSSDTVNLVFKGTDGYSNGVNATTIAGVETINITTDDTDSTAATTAFTSIITAAAVKTVKISGDAGFNASTGLAATTLTSFDASGVTATGTGGAVSLTTGDLAADATLIGGAGTNTINASAVTASKVMTITGGAGLDNLIGGAGNDVISGGAGGTTGTGLVGNAGNDTITGGAGTDTINGGAGADTLTGGAGVDTFVFTTGDSTRVNMDTITDLAVGTGGDSVTLIDQGAEVGVAGGVLTATKTDVSLAGTFLEALDIASAGNGSTNGIVTWFQYGGDTYLVQDNSSSTTNDAATDLVIKITGTVDLLEGTNLAITFA